MVPLSEQRSRVLILVNSCVHILYAVAALVLASFAVGLISDETHAADNGIQRNWETNMIIDIQSSKAESCPLVMIKYLFLFWMTNKQVIFARTNRSNLIIPSLYFSQNNELS